MVTSLLNLLMLNVIFPSWTLQLIVQKMATQLYRNCLSCVWMLQTFIMRWWALCSTMGSTRLSEATCGSNSFTLSLLDYVFFNCVSVCDRFSLSRSDHWVINHCTFVHTEITEMGLWRSIRLPCWYFKSVESESWIISHKCKCCFQHKELPISIGMYSHCTMN